MSQNTMVRCAECGVWIPEAESKPLNYVDPLLYVSLRPHDGDRHKCADQYACARRRKDKVGPTSGSH